MTDRKEYKKAYYQAHKEEIKAQMKAWREAHREEKKAWQQSHREEIKEYKKAWKQSHKEEIKEYIKADVNSLGQSKASIRLKSRYYIKKYGIKIPGYEIHHCFTYNEPYKFIYCSKEMHRLIHAYLRQHNIDADSNHYEYIKHLLDDTVVLYGIE